MEYGDYNEIRDDQPTTRFGKWVQRIFLIGFVLAFSALLIWVYFGAPNNTRSSFATVEGKTHSFSASSEGSCELSKLRDALQMEKALPFSEDFQKQYPLVSGILNGTQSMPPDGPLVVDEGGMFVLIRQSKSERMEVENLDVFLLPYHGTQTESGYQVTAEAPQRFTVSYRKPTVDVVLEEVDGETFMSLPYRIGLVVNSEETTVVDAEYELILNTPVQSAQDTGKFYENHVVLQGKEEQTAVRRKGGEGSDTVSGYYGSRLFENAKECGISLKLDDTVLASMKEFTVTVALQENSPQATFRLTAN